MTAILAVLLGLAIGTVLGALGGGGAILTVPALVYVLRQPPQEATTSSLLIVGLTALVGVSSYLPERRIDLKVGIVFALLGVPATWAGSALNHRANEDVLLLGFSLLMLVAANAMIGRRSASRVSAAPRQPVISSDAALAAGHHMAASVGGPAVQPGEEVPGAGTVAAKNGGVEGPRSARPIMLVLTALAVGLLTGFFGVGGGFVILPALVVVLGLPMQQAVGTSLLVIALNSATSLAARGGDAHVQLDIVGPFTAAAMIATIAGKRIADRIPVERLRRAFAVLLVVVALFMAWQSGQSLLGG
jgi:uncharacterized membrane protein YfcA